MYINYVTVVIAAIAAMIVGWIWYTPAVFGNAWMRSMGKKKQDMSGGNAAMLWMLLATLVMAYVFAYLIGLIGVSGIWEGAQTGFVTWFGFVLPVSVSRMLFEKQPKEQFWINALYYLVSLVIMGAILAGWQ